MFEEKIEYNKYDFGFLAVPYAEALNLIDFIRKNGAFFILPGEPALGKTAFGLPLRRLIHRPPAKTAAVYLAPKTRRVKMSV